MDDKTSESENKREFVRIPLRMKTELIAGEKRIGLSNTRDVSLKGIFIETDNKLTLGTECALTLHIGDGGFCIQTSGKVVRCEENGLGIEIIEVLGLESWEHLKNLVIYNAPEPEKVKMEIHSHLGLKH